MELAKTATCSFARAMRACQPSHFKYLHTTSVNNCTKSAFTPYRSFNVLRDVKIGTLLKKYENRGFYIKSDTRNMKNIGDMYTVRLYSKQPDLFSSPSEYRKYLPQDQLNQPKFTDGGKRTLDFFKNIAKAALILIAASTFAYILPFGGTTMIILSLGLSTMLAWFLLLPFIMTVVLLFLVTTFVWIPHYIMDILYYERSFDENIVKALNEDPKAVELFGSPIVPYASFNEISSETVEDMVELTITKQFPVQGPKSKGYAVCTATAKKQKFPTSYPTWKIDQLYWYPKETEAKFSYTGKRIEIK